MPQQYPGLFSTPAQLRRYISLMSFVLLYLSLALWLPMSAHSDELMTPDVAVWANSQNDIIEGLKPEGLLICGDAFYFFREVPRDIYDYHDNDGELWQSDGTAYQTFPVASVLPNQYICVDDAYILYLNSDSELYKYDSTSSQSTFLKKFTVSSFSGTLRLLDSVGDIAYIYKVGGEAESERNGVWASDGTPSGTTLIAERYIGTPCCSDLQAVATTESTFYFMSVDDIYGHELWKSDGTSAGTRLVRDFSPGIESSRFRAMTSVGDLLYLLTETGALWVTDGTLDGTLFLANVTGPNGATPSYSSASFASMNSNLYFPGYDPQNGAGLWKSDGTPAGTELVKSYSYDDYDPLIEHMHSAGNRLFFPLRSREIGKELWTSDGTPEGTRLVKDLLPGREDSGIVGTVDMQNALYFFTGADAFGSMPDEAKPAAFWTSDGSADGTSEILPIRFGYQSPIVFNDYLYFAGYAHQSGIELWQSDGTADGTKVLRVPEPIVETGTGTIQLEAITEPDAVTFFSYKMGSDDYFQVSTQTPYISAKTPVGLYLVEQLATDSTFHLRDVQCDDGDSLRPSLPDLANQRAIVYLNTDETVTCTFINSLAGEIELSVAADADEVMINEPVNYLYTVTNSGRVPLTNIQIQDERLGLVPIAQDRLEPSEVVTGLLQYTPTGLDLPGPLVNPVTVSSTAPAGPNPLAQASTSVTLLASPEAALQVTPVVPKVSGGDVVSYTVVISNLGFVPLYNVTLASAFGTSDSQPLIVAIADVLSPNQRHTTVITATIPADQPIGPLTSRMELSFTAQQGASEILRTESVQAVVEIVAPEDPGNQDDEPDESPPTGPTDEQQTPPPLDGPVDEQPSDDSGNGDDENDDGENDETPDGNESPNPSFVDIFLPLVQ